MYISIQGLAACMCVGEYLCAAVLEPSIWDSFMSSRDKAAVLWCYVNILCAFNALFVNKIDNSRDAGLVTRAVTPPRRFI